MAIITRDKVYGYNVKLRGLPPLWFGQRSTAIQFLSTSVVWSYIQNP